VKKYLLTWYGITDFKSSLEMLGNGPILSALLAEEYSDVVILGYTKSSAITKDNPSPICSFQNELSKLQNIPLSNESERIWRFVETFANTIDAHRHFVRWLEKQLLEYGRRTKVTFKPVTLHHLNDTEGIYEAATQSLNEVSAEEDEKLVTLYLSPGTPVMAFVWAFVALRYPNLKKRLIASSQPERPPEEIALPIEWLEWHGRQVNTSKTDTERYDVIFHLFGEQRMPNLLGVLQFSSSKHIFVNSEQFPAGVMRQFLGEAEYCEISVDPYDPENVRSTILEQIEDMSADIRIGFNLTGGTKLMYAGALAACRNVNATPFYFNSRNNMVVFLNDFKTVDTKLIPSVETFFKLNGNNLFISKPGNWDDIRGIQSNDRKNLTNELWQARSKIRRLYKELIRYNDYFEPFELRDGVIHAKLLKDKSAKISIGTKHFEFREWPDFAKYLCGGWFEEYTYMKLQPLVEDGLIRDVHINLEVSIKEDSSENRTASYSKRMTSLRENTYQELDIVFTDGRRLYVIECKAGSVKSEHIMKLQNIIRYFGGIEGKSILVSCFPPYNKVVRKKIDDSKNIQSVSGNNFFKQLEKIIQSGGSSK
jgi:hypothetical protein